MAYDKKETFRRERRTSQSCVIGAVVFYLFRLAVGGDLLVEDNGRHGIDISLPKGIHEAGSLRGCVAAFPDQVLDRGPVLCALSKDSRDQFGNVPAELFTVIRRALREARFVSEPGIINLLGGRGKVFCDSADRNEQHRGYEKSHDCRPSRDKRLHPTYDGLTQEANVVEPGPQTVRLS